MICYSLIAAISIAAISAEAIEGGQLLTGPRPGGGAVTLGAQRDDKGAEGRVPGAPPQNPSKLQAGITGTSLQAGIKVEMSITPVTAGPNRKGTLVEDDSAVFSFRLTDAATGNPISGVHPTAWMDLSPSGEVSDAKACDKRIASYLGRGILDTQPIDLNIYYVISLNDDSTITVVDPRFNYGGTRLLAMTQLRSPGADWALTSDQRKLFVSMPLAGQVAAVDTASWKVTSNILVGDHPGRIGIQPDEQYLWVADDGVMEGAGRSEVAAITTEGLKLVARIPVGLGRHDIAFSDDNRFLFVTNEGAGSVSIIDIRKLEKIRDIRVGPSPHSIAFSTSAKLAFVVCSGDGSIAALSGDRPGVVASLRADAGLEQIRFAPGDRYGFVVNATAGKVYVLDASKNRIIQSASIDGEPDQVTFSGTLAYLRRRKSETILMIPLAQIGVEGKAIAIADFPGGEHAFGFEAAPSLAANIVKAPEENAILLANPGDKSIYYYMEGMAAPMGTFSNYGRKPRAVLVVDRSLRERSPGVYSTVARLRGAGMYDVAFLLTSPRVTNCFPAPVAADPDRRARDAGPAKVEFLSKSPLVETGAATTLEFKLTDPRTGKLLTGIADLQVLAFLAPGIWQTRLAAKQIGEGVYSANFVPPRDGVYYIHVSSRSLGLGLKNSQYGIIESKKNSRERT